jgi:hypothetical protein
MRFNDRSSHFRFQAIGMVIARLAHSAKQRRLAKAEKANQDC